MSRGGQEGGVLERMQRSGEESAKSQEARGRQPGGGGRGRVCREGSEGGSVKGVRRIAVVGGGIDKWGQGRDGCAAWRERNEEDTPSGRVWALRGGGLRDGEDDRGKNGVGGRRKCCLHEGPAGCPGGREEGEAESERRRQHRGGEGGIGTKTSS